MMKRKCDAVLSVLITVPIVLLYWKYAVTGQKGDILSMADSGNVICYIMMIILFLAAYFSSFYIMERVSYQTLIPYTTGRLLFMALFLLLLCGTSLFDAVNLAMSATATGGFATTNGSAADFHSLSVELVLIIFMLIGGGNFGLYFLAYKKGYKYIIRDTEFRVYLAI